MWSGFAGRWPCLLLAAMIGAGCSELMSYRAMTAPADAAPARDRGDPTPDGPLREGPPDFAPDGPACSDECPTAGARICDGQRSYRACAASHDADSCLEWGPTTSCAADEICQAHDGSCAFSCAVASCACDPGAIKSCGIGACQGSRICAEGQWGACNYTVSPSAEICDAIDNDCDGEVDEGVCGCQPQCGGAACGADDGCGGTCSGTCGSNSQCVLGSGGVYACNCATTVCGSSCCGPGQLCVDKKCQTCCQGIVCGPDAKCGGYLCGACIATENCVNGKCVPF